MRVVEVEDRIVATHTQIVWVLEEDVQGVDGTMASCVEFMETAGSDVGWCVGDGQTEPDAGEFDDSPFAIGRGFDFVVGRTSMRIDYVSNHGTPNGNDNPTADEIATAIEAL